MKKLLLVLMVCVTGVLVAPHDGLAQEQTDYKNVVVVKGLVHVERDAAQAIKSISITTDQGKTITVKVDDVSKGLVQIDGRRVFATGTLQDNIFSVQTWFMSNRK